MEKRMFSIRVSEKVLTNFKKTCVLKKTSMTAVVENLIVDFVKNQNKLVKKNVKKTK